jgi:putative radical SAM enzyme (TIGR03279 family)
MRETLYIRDDDYRLSFRYGNFATLTNLKPKDVQRIVEYKLSPLYVSVHATDPIVRRRLLRNPHAPAIIPQLAHFAAAGIRVHTQIVVQPGVNDGDVLRQTLEDLYQLRSAVLSVSVVPVGLTAFSKEHLVREPTAEECRACARTVDRFAERALDERGSHWAYGSDDLYLVGDLPLPPASRYDGFEQVENGVGSVRFLQAKIAGFSARLSGTRIGVVTGSAMGRLMPQVLPALETATGGAFGLLVLDNDVFGPSVTTAGLLSGRSIARTLASRRDLDLALIPAEALNDEEQFIDNTTLEEIAAGAPMEIRPSFHFTDAFEGTGR